MKKQSSFGEIITKKVHDEKGWTLRDFYKKLESKSSKISLTKLSKIMRGIQNPSNKQEFDELMDILEVKEPERSQLENLANNFVPVQKPTEEEILKSMPIFINKQFKDEKEAENFSEKFKEIIKQDYEPEL